MIVRTVLAVVLAAALLGASQPAVERATRERTAAVLAENVDRLADRARALVETDDAVGTKRARRVVPVRLPAAAPTWAGVDRLTVTPAESVSSESPDTSTVSWQVVGGDRHRRVIEGIHFLTADRTPLVLEEAGRHRLVLSLTGSNADPRVRVERYDPGGSPDG